MLSAVQVPASSNRAPGSEIEHAPSDPRSPRSDPWFGWTEQQLALSAAGEIVIVAS